MYFLDTNICVYFLQGKFDSIKDKLKNINPKDIKIPAIVKAELLYGAEKSGKKSQNIQTVVIFLLPFEIIDFDDKSSIQYSKLRAKLENKGTPIGPNEYIIASIVLANNGILVIHNQKEFKRVKSLKIEDWTR